MLCQSQISQGQGFQSATLKDFVCSQKMTDKETLKSYYTTEKFCYVARNLISCAYEAAT